MADVNQASDLEKLKLEVLSSYAVKAELYVVSLTFSILALSVQFPVDVADKLAAQLQAVAWFLLTVAGIAGVKALRNISVEYNLELSKNMYKHAAAKAERGFDKLSKESFAEIITKSVAEIRGQGKWLFPLQGYCLVAGLFCLVAARIVAAQILW